MTLSISSSTNTHNEQTSSTHLDENDERLVDGEVFVRGDEKARLSGPRARHQLPVVGDSDELRRRRLLPRAQRDLVLQLRSAVPAHTRRLTCNWRCCQQDTLLVDGKNAIEEESGLRNGDARVASHLLVLMVASVWGVMMMVPSHVSGLVSCRRSKTCVKEDVSMKVCEMESQIKSSQVKSSHTHTHTQLSVIFRAANTDLDLHFVRQFPVVLDLQSARRMRRDPQRDNHVTRLFGEQLNSEVALCLHLHLALRTQSVFTSDNILGKKILFNFYF